MRFWLTTSLWLMFTIFIQAETIENSQFGFSVAIPESYVALPLDEVSPDTLYYFADHIPTPDAPAIVVRIQRLRGRISLDAPMSVSDVPAADGVSTTLQKFEWKQHILNAIRQDVALPAGGSVVVYTIQYPLAEEAVQLQVAGPMEQDRDTYNTFVEVANGFVNTQPLDYQNDGAPPTHLMPSERTQRVLTGILQLVATAVLGVIIYRIMTSRRAKPPSSSEH